MGCDIHLYVEKYDKVEGVWKKLPRLGFNDRDYHLFGLLAGVRYYDDNFLLSVPRGVPEDASWGYRKIVNEWDSDGHSHSYFTLNEILNHDIWNTVVNCNITVAESEARRYLINKNKNNDDLKVYESKYSPRRKYILLNQDEYLVWATNQQDADEKTHTRRIREFEKELDGIWKRSKILNYLSDYLFRYRFSEKFILNNIDYFDISKLLISQKHLSPEFKDKIKFMLTLKDNIEKVTYEKKHDIIVDINGDFSLKKKFSYFYNDFLVKKLAKKVDNLDDIRICFFFDN